MQPYSSDGYGSERNSACKTFNKYRDPDHDPDFKKSRNMITAHSLWTTYYHLRQLYLTNKVDYYQSQSL